MGTINITASIDGVMHGSAPAGNHSPVWSEIIEDFSDGRYIINTGEAGEDQYIVRSDPLPFPGSASLSTDTPKSTAGASLKTEVTGLTPGSNDANVLRYWMLPNEGPTGGNYNYLHQYTKAARDRGTEGTSTGRLANYYDHIRLWVKFPATFLSGAAGAGFSFDIGTFTRASYETPDSQEAGGWHYYHSGHAGYIGPDVWHQIIITDTVNNVRSGHPDRLPIGTGTLNSGATDWFNDPWEQVGTNYFDMLTSLYVDTGERAGIEGSIEVGDFVLLAELEFYKERYDETVIDPWVLNLSGAYNAPDNRLFVSWSNNIIYIQRSPYSTDPAYAKYRDNDFEAVYSFSNLHVNGWSSGTSLGTIAPVGAVDCRIDTTGITMGSNNVIFVAIRPLGGVTNHSNQFKQIAIPLTAAGYDTVLGEKAAGGAI